MAGLYDVFQTDENLEQAGVVVDYGDFRIRIAAASAANKRYSVYAEKKLKPVRRAMETGALSNERGQAIMADIYSKTIVLNWETMVDKEWKVGIEPKGGGDLLPFTPETVQETLTNLPRLLLDLQEQAQSLANFRKAELEEEVKN